MAKAAKNAPLNIAREHYAMTKNDTDSSAEIKMYGQVVKERPIDYWTGEPVDGDFIISSEFIKDLELLGKCKKLNLRLDSVGGDVKTAIVIHNRLRELSRNGTEINCIVDGVAMSAGSMIMCAADNVSVNATSLVMIHKSWTFCFGGYNADDLRKAAEENDKYDLAIVAAYKRKTGISEDELLAMMSETVYMTGEEAVEKGFADALLENAEKIEIAACADKSAIVVNGRTFPLFGAPCPENIPKAILPAQGAGIANKTNLIKEGDTMAEKIAGQTEKNPAPAAEIGNKVTVQGTSDDKKDGENAAIKAAVEAERERLARIDEIAQLYDPETVKAAKYGDKSCTAEELAYRAAVENAKKGRKYLDELSADAQTSNVDKVPAASVPDDLAPKDKTDADKFAEALAIQKAAFEAANGGEKNDGKA